MPAELATPTDGSTASSGSAPPVKAMPRSSVSGAERAVIGEAFARLDSVALGIGVGAVSGLALALSTLALVVRGGEDVGLHLSRLGYFLPGYSVTPMGVFVGLVEGAVLGFLAGGFLAVLWNAYHHFFVNLLLAREHSRNMRRELQEL